MNTIASALNAARAPLIGAKAANLAKLPECCYSFIETSAPGERIVVIKAGEQGCYVTDLDDPSRGATALMHLVDKLNARLGVSRAQREAMVAGSMFGWHVQGANPDAYGYGMSGWRIYCQCLDVWDRAEVLFLRGTYE